MSDLLTLPVPFYAVLLILALAVFLCAVVTVAAVKMVRAERRLRA